MDRIEQKICDIIDQNQEKIKDFGRDIWTHAELGYRETRTAGKFVQWLRELGIETEENLAVTGAKGYLNGKGAEGITVAVMGEYDALPIAAHKDANPETGASHCCGHNAQLTGVVGAALALSDPEVRAAMDGNIVFFGVPSEEYVEVDYKNGLREQGVVRYGGGKCELIRIGAMDDIDITIGHHSSASFFGVKLANETSNGFVNKMVAFEGLASHAAGSPHKGLDAMNAAMLAGHAIDIQRESFRDCDTVRIHSYISKGAEAVNVIADDVRVEYSVRAGNIDAIRDASRKVDRALRAGGMATGCGVKITTLPGYLPTIPAKDTRAVDEAMETAAAGKYEVSHANGGHETGSTDYGDLSSIMPLLQFNTGGYTGMEHNANLTVVDEYLAYVVTAKVFALTAYNLLKNGGDYAKALLSSYEALLTKEQYIEYMESMLTEEHMPQAPLPIVGE